MFGFGTSRRGHLSSDNELLTFGGCTFNFICCVYAQIRLTELTGAADADCNRRIGRVVPEGLPIYSVCGVKDRRYVIVMEDDTMLLYQKNIEKNAENTCQKHHKDL